jgi:hypothetical protein
MTTAVQRGEHAGGRVVARGIQPIMAAVDRQSAGRMKPPWTACDSVDVRSGARAFLGSGRSAATLRPKLEFAARRIGGGE